MINDKELSDYAEHCLSHNSGEEFFNSIQENISNYRPIHLSVEYRGLVDTLKRAELELAREAKGKGLRAATNIDYCQYNPDQGWLIIAATGWRKK